MMYKVISFDIGGTLLETDGNNKYSLDRLVEIISLPKDIVRTVYKEVFQKKKGTLIELVTLFCKTLNIDLTNEILQFFSEKYRKENNVGKLNSDACEVIQKLKNMGYKIILFSNSCCLINNEMDNKLLQNIDRIFYSYDLGYTKSDTQSYRIIEEEMGYGGSEILHIGDTLSSDYVNPIKNGWNAIYYGKNNDKSILSMESLTEIIDVLEILRGNIYGEKGFNKRRTN